MGMPVVSNNLIWYTYGVYVELIPIYFTESKGLVDMNVGITRIVHILDKNGKIMSVKHLQKKYQLNLKQQ